MPITDHYRAYLDRLYRESEAHEQRYSNTLYQHIPAEERDAERRRYIAIFNAEQRAA